MELRFTEFEFMELWFKQAGFDEDTGWPYYMHVAAMGLEDTVDFEDTCKYLYRYTGNEGADSFWCISSDLGSWPREGYRVLAPQGPIPKASPEWEHLTKKREKALKACGGDVYPRVTIALEEIYDERV